MYVVSLRLPFEQFIVKFYLVLNYYNLLFRICVGAGNILPSNMSGYTKKFSILVQKLSYDPRSSESCLMQKGRLLYRVSQEECARLRESVPYVILYRYNPKHLCPKLNGYGDNGQRKVWASLV